MIYFIGTTKKVKIGFSLNPTKRLSDIKRDNPEELFLYFVDEGDRTKEFNYHQKFKDYHIQNEWFSISGELKKFLDKNNKNIVKYSRKRIKHFGELSKLRTKEGLTLQMLADKMGTKPASLWGIEIGFEKNATSLNSLKKYCDGLDYDVIITFEKRVLKE